MSEKERDLKIRTRKFALAIIDLFDLLPKGKKAEVIGGQFLRSGTSVGAHYREGVFSRSNAESISKLEGALQELEETAYWLELSMDAKLLLVETVQPIYDEAQELIKILSTCVLRLKAKR